MRLSVLDRNLRICVVSECICMCREILKFLVVEKSKGHSCSDDKAVLCWPTVMYMLDENLRICAP